MGVEASGRLGKRGGDLLMALFFRAQIEWAVDDYRHDHQWDNFVSLNVFNVAALGEACCHLVRGHAGGGGYVRSRVVFLAEEGEKWRPPRLGHVAWSFDRGVGGEQRSECGEMLIEPSF